MKKITTFFALLAIGAMAFAQTGANAYSSKSGKITYRYELEDMDMTYTLIFDDFGKKQAFEMENKLDGEVQKSKTIITPENMFMINYEDKQVIKFPVNTDDESMEMYGGADGGFDLSGLVAEVTGEASGKKGTETVLGKKCDLYEYADPDGSKGKYWIHKGFLIKAEFIDEDGKHAFMEVTEYKVDVVVNKSEFDIPAGFQVQDMTKMMEQMKQMQQMYGVPGDDE